MAGDATDLQRAYYVATAGRYDAMHVRDDDEHGFALSFLVGCLGHFGFESLLDVGSGTGRALMRVKTACPTIAALGSSHRRNCGRSVTPKDCLIGD